MTWCSYSVQMLVVYLGFAYSFDLRGSSLLLLLLLVLLQLLLSEHLQVGWGERLSLCQLHTCGWMEGSGLVTLWNGGLSVRDQISARLKYLV